MEEIFELKRQKLPLEYSFAVVSLKVVEKGKRRFIPEPWSTKKGVLNVQSIHLIPGDDKGMRVAIRLCLGRNLYALGLSPSLGISSAF